MLILAFETSAKSASVALSMDGKLLGESYQNTGLTHSQTLMVMAQDLLKQCGYGPQDLDAVAVAAGPGSFTGVRIGVAAAKGLAWGLEKPCYGVSTLESMALGLGAYDGTVCPVMDARRSQVYYLKPGKVSLSAWRRTGPFRWRIWQPSCRLPGSPFSWWATAAS